MKKVCATIKPPDIKTAIFRIEGTAPLVVHRMSEKFRRELEGKVVSGSTPGDKNKKKYKPENLDELCQQAKYIGETKGKRWEGFNASGMRQGIVRACSLTDKPMTLAKLSIFVVADGYDIINPLYPLVRIIGKSERSEMIARNAMGGPVLAVRPMYFPWAAVLKLRYDIDQFSLDEVAALLYRVGEQVGICEGRPFSKDSTGMGWGTFRIVNEK